MCGVFWKKVHLKIISCENGVVWFKIRGNRFFNGFCTFLGQKFVQRKTIQIFRFELQQECFFFSSNRVKFKTLNSRHTVNIIIRVRKERVSFIILCLKIALKTQLWLLFYKTQLWVLSGIRNPISNLLPRCAGLILTNKVQNNNVCFCFGQNRSRKQIDWKIILRTIEMWISVEVFLHATNLN